MRPGLRSRIDTEHLDDRLFHATTGKDTHERRLLEQEKQLCVINRVEKEMWPKEELNVKVERREVLTGQEQLSIIERTPEVGFLRQEKQTENEKTERKEVLNGEKQLSIIERAPELESRRTKNRLKNEERDRRDLSIMERAPELELLKPKEQIENERIEKMKHLSITERAPPELLESLKTDQQLRAVVHAGDDDGCTRSHDRTFACHGSLTKSRTEARTTSKRWSFCYGDSDSHSLISKTTSHSAGSLDDTSLTEAHPERRKTRLT